MACTVCPDILFLSFFLRLSMWAGMATGSTRPPPSSTSFILSYPPSSLHSLTPHVSTTHSFLPPLLPRPGFLLRGFLSPPPTPPPPRPFFASVAHRRHEARGAEACRGVCAHNSPSRLPNEDVLFRGNSSTCIRSHSWHNAPAGASSMSPTHRETQPNQTPGNAGWSLRY